MKKHADQQKSWNSPRASALVATGAARHRKPKGDPSSWPAVTAPSIPSKLRWFASADAVASANQFTIFLHFLSLPLNLVATLILIWYCLLPGALDYSDLSCARQHPSFSRFVLVTHKHVCIIPVFLWAATNPLCTSPLSFFLLFYLATSDFHVGHTFFVYDTPLDLLSLSLYNLYTFLHCFTSHLSCWYLPITSFSFQFFELVYYLFCFNFPHFVFTNLNILLCIFYVTFCNILTTNIFVSNHKWENFFSCW